MANVISQSFINCTGYFNIGIKLYFETHARAFKAQEVIGSVASTSSIEAPVGNNQFQSQQPQSRFPPQQQQKKSDWDATLNANKVRKKDLYNNIFELKS